MTRARTLIYGSAVGAALGVVLAPRLGESRRVALERLRLSLRPGRGALDAFAGTPCATAARSSNNHGRDAAGVAATATRGDGDGG